MRSLPGISVWVRRFQWPVGVGRTSGVAEQDLYNSCGDQLVTFHNDEGEGDTPAMLENAHGGDKQCLGRGIV